MPDYEMGDEEEEDGLLWVDEQEATPPDATTSVETKDSVAGLESELSRIRAELTEVRRELAAKVSTGYYWYPIFRCFSFAWKLCAWKQQLNDL